MTATCESFVDFCDRMQVDTSIIATEGLKEGIHNFKNFLIKKISQLIDWIERKLMKIKNPRIRNGLVDITRSLKGLLAKTKGLNEVNPDMANRFSKEAETLEQRAKKMIEQSNDLETFAFRDKNNNLNVGMTKNGQTQSRAFNNSSNYDVTKKGRIIDVGNGKKVVNGNKIQTGNIYHTYDK